MKKYLFLLVFFITFPIIGDVKDLEISINESVEKIDNSENSLVMEYKELEEGEGQDLAYLLDFIKANKTYGIDEEKEASFRAEYQSLKTGLVSQELLDELLSELKKLRSRINLRNRELIETEFFNIYGSVGVDEEFKEFIASKDIIPTKVLDELYLVYLEGSGDADGVLTSKYLSYFGFSPESTLQDIKSNNFIKESLWVTSLSPKKKIEGSLIESDLDIKSINLYRDQIDIFINSDYWDLLPIMIIDSEFYNYVLRQWNILAAKSDRELMEAVNSDDVTYQDIIAFRDLFRLLAAKSNDEKFNLLKELYR